MIVRFLESQINHTVEIIFLLDLLEGEQNSSVGDLITRKLYMFFGAFYASYLAIFVRICYLIMEKCLYKQM